MVNAPGWDLLFNGSMIQAAYVVYDTALFTGWIVLVLYFLFHAMAWLKTKKVESGFFIGVIFLAMYLGGMYGTAFVLPGWVIAPMVIVLIFEIGIMLYSYIMK